MKAKNIHPTDLPLGRSLIYKFRHYAIAFGRERDEEGKVEYYWIQLADGKRIKALPEDLKLNA